LVFSAVPLETFPEAAAMRTQRPESKFAERSARERKRYFFT